MISHSRIETISSANRTAGTNEDFYYQITPWSNEDDFDSICVLYANIPVSYYMVPSTSNTFTVNENGNIRTVQIDPGNYNVNSFMAALTLKLNTGGLGWTYSMTFPNLATQVQTGLITYTVTGNTSLEQPSFQFTNNLHKLMGFATNSTNVFVGNTLTSSVVVNYVPENTLYLYSDCIETKDSNSENILQEFFASNSSIFSNVVYQCTAPLEYSKPLRGKGNNYFHFTLLDEFYEVMNLNGQPFTFTILLYKQNNIYDILKAYIKSKLF